MTSSCGFSPTLTIEVAATGRPAAVVLVSTALALVAVLVARLPGPVAAAAGAIVLGGGLATAWRARPSAPGSVRRLRFGPDGQLRAVLGRREGPVAADASLLGSWRLARVAVGMRLVVPGCRPGTVLLFRDHVPAADWRRLAVHLRLGPAGD